jgi:23S rRNA (cytosine1962-C5)-methyltransferase
VSHDPPCLLFEDEHLLVVNKPPGLNTHAPNPYAGEGIYDWLKHREPRWASLAIIHRLDKETSGVLVFGKTAFANRELTKQFTQRTVRKSYLLLTEGPVPRVEFLVRSSLARVGNRYTSRPTDSGPVAETRFRYLQAETSGLALVEARPLTGRTHQIRVHAAEKGFPILGDVLYGGRPAPRVYLHAMELTLAHPVGQAAMTFKAEPTFAFDSRLMLREALLSPELTNCYRLAHGGSDRLPVGYLDRLGEFVLASAVTPEALIQDAATFLEQCRERYHWRGVYLKHLMREPTGRTTTSASPQAALGEPAAEEFTVLENGMRYSLSFSEGYSVGLFLDQRDNRRCLLMRHVAANFPLFAQGAANPPSVLNTFAYTCAFSVCAAKSGAHTTSLDLSRKYLTWGQRNFRLNGLNPDHHEFIYGDAFDWLYRLAKKNRLFEVVLLDPPTFSHSKGQGIFQAEKDYGRLIRAALPLLRPGGVLFASTNSLRFPPESFLETVRAAVAASGRVIRRFHYFPQPPDFPISRDEPGHLKTVWAQVH